MEKNIIKRETFKEAFADVLVMSHEELVRHSIDPFLREAFDLFEKMDFSCKNINSIFSFDLNVDFLSDYQSSIHRVSAELLKKNIFSSTLYAEKNHIFYVNELNNIHLYISSMGCGNQQTSGRPSCENEDDEVGQWLLAA